MRPAATASPAQHTDGSAEPYQPMAAPAEERVMDERIKAAIAAIAASALAQTAAQATNPAQLSNQAQTDAADAAQRPSATAAGAQTLQRIEATIATRAPATAYPREREREHSTAHCHRLDRDCRLDRHRCQSRDLGYQARLRHAPCCRSPRDDLCTAGHHCHAPAPYGLRLRHDCHTQPWPGPHNPQPLPLFPDVPAKSTMLTPTWPSRLPPH